MNEEYYGSVNEGKETGNEVKENKYKMSLKSEQPAETKPEDLLVSVETPAVENSFSINKEKTIQEEVHSTPFFYESQNGSHLPEGNDTVVVKEKGFHPSPIMLLAGAVIAVLLILVMMDGFKKEPGKLDGSYEFASAEYGGVSMSSGELKSKGVDAEGLALEIDGENAVLDMGGKSAECELEIDGDDLTLKKGDSVLNGEFDLDEETVTIEASGVDLIFEKI